MRYFFFIFLLSGLYASAQTNDMARDTVHINEVLITKYSSKYKMKAQGLRGPCYSSDNLNDAQEIITLMEKLPEGEINTITFYFNEMLEAYKRQPENFQDKDFELLLYRVGTDNMPGEKLVTETMILRLKKEHVGSVKINISGLGVKNPGKLFVGLKLLGERTKNDFVIDCLCNGHDKYFTFFKAPGDASWNRRWACAALKVDMNIAVKK